MNWINTIMSRYQKYVVVSSLLIYSSLYWPSGLIHTNHIKITYIVTSIMLTIFLLLMQRSLCLFWTLTVFLDTLCPLDSWRKFTITTSTPVNKLQFHATPMFVSKSPATTPWKNKPYYSVNSNDNGHIFYNEKKTISLLRPP